VLRFLRWQLSTRLVEMPVVIPWIGAIMYVYGGLHEAAVMAFMLYLLRPAVRFRAACASSPIAAP
jgi:hypothetical protein